MATFYSFECTDCKEKNITLEEGEAPGVIVIGLPMGERDSTQLCVCGEKLKRIVIGDRFTVLWGNKYNNKKTSLGPSIDYYPPSKDRARKDRTRHVDMTGSNRSSERQVELKQDAAKAPTRSDLPPAGVSIPKG